MEYLKSLGILGIILYVAYVLIGRGRRDKIITDLEVKPSKERQQENIDIAIATKEAADAVIKYNNSRREYDSISGEEQSTDNDPLA